MERSLLDFNLGEILRKVRRKYHLAIPQKVVMVDYDDKVGDLYIRFKETVQTEGEPTNDGLLIIHRDRNVIAAIEILNLDEFSK